MTWILDDPFRIAGFAMAIACGVSLAAIALRTFTHRK